MSRTVVVVIAAAAILAAVGALEWYSRVATGLASGGPVPLQSIAPRAPLESTAPRASTAPRVPPAVRHTVRPPQPSSSPATPESQQSAATGPPRILAMSLSAPVATGGQVVTGTVTTSPDVTSVQASLAGYSTALTRVSPGYFALSYRVPQLPPVLRRTYTIEVVAQNARGQSATSSLPITIR